jgi:hypothetical protein
MADSEDLFSRDPVEVPWRWATARRGVGRREGIAFDRPGPADIVIDRGNAFELIAVGDAAAMTFEHEVSFREPER